MNLIDGWTHESNYGNGKGGPGVNRGRLFVIMHGTGKYPTTPAHREISYLRSPNVRVSYHAYITKRGAAHQMVPFGARAWHAGSSAWTFPTGNTYTDLNDWSVGVALESSNGAEEVYPPEQVACALEIVREIMGMYGIPASFVRSHREVSVPEGRKVDPVNFDMDAFRLQLAGPESRRVPLYTEGNVELGEVTIVEDRKAYVPNEILEELRRGR